ncbi:hypothetical protein [Bosea sp. UC22_33]|uniref:hypothetical protein n=1 Tax=Bosea sp. UC22_33 TaxID=3350165 RepID=UPI00366F4875
MKLLGMALVLNSASILCALAAVLLAYHGKDGWGWFLFGALVLHAGYKSSDKE